MYDALAVGFVLVEILHHDKLHDDAVVQSFGGAVALRVGGKLEVAVGVNFAARLQPMFALLELNGSHSHRGAVGKYDPTVHRVRRNISAATREQARDNAQQAVGKR